MSFTRDWANTSPVDHTLVSNVPSSIRATRVDNSDRLSAIISGFVSGETVKGVLNLPFIAQSTPSTVTDQIQLYGKAVGGKTELHTCDEDGNESQITKQGGPSGLNLTAAQLMALVGPLIYPVGSYYVNEADGTNPGTLFGFGTWTAIQDRMVIGKGSTFPTAGATGGATTKDLSHTHTFTTGGVNFGGGGSLTAGALDTAHYHTGTTASGGSATQDIMNPYVVAYIWKRTA